MKRAERVARPDTVNVIFFDVGGVLIGDDAESILRRQSRTFGIPLNALREEMRPDRFLLMKGAISRREYLRGWQHISA